MTSGVLIATLLGAPAQAEEPPVALPDPVPGVALPVELDRAAFYEAQKLCDPVARPGANALASLLQVTYGPATVYIPRGCTSSTSEHFDGRAVDWMRSVRVPEERAQAEAFVNWLLAPAADGTPHAMARRLGMMYIIWNNRMIRMYDPGRGWTNYRNCLSSARGGTSLDTSCHRNHVHFSMSWDGAGAVTSWWTGVAQTQPFCSAATTRAVPGSGSTAVVGAASDVPGLVQVPATTILDTRAGAGARLSGPCRALAGRSLYPTARVTGIVPPEARSVVLKVTSSSNAPARLSVWSSGGTRPTGQVSTPIGTTEATVLVPVASDGSIGLSTSLGAANISAAVIGYTAGGAAVPSVRTGADPPAVVEQEEAVVASVSSRPTKPRAVKVKTLKYKKGVKTRWKVPRKDGGAAVTGYVVEALRSKKKGAKVAGSCTVGPTARACKIKKLKKRKYWMSVSVSNEAGRTWAKRAKVRVRAPKR